MLAPIHQAPLSRREFMQALSAVPITALAPGKTLEGEASAYFTNIDHWHQAGVGWHFRRGVVAGKEYHRAFSIFYGVQKTIDAVKRWPWLTICLEFDSHAYEAMHAEDPDFVKTKFRPEVEAGHIDITGGTFSQPYSQLIGWQANVRQLVEGREIVRRLLGKDVECFLVEEIIFHPQLPQLLRLCGFRYASLQSQNNGSAPLIEEAVINWRGLDGTEVPTIPNNKWMISLSKQYQSLAEDVTQDLISEKGLLTIWAEIWPPGMDWGASYLPYDQGIHSLRDKGLKSVGVNEYMELRCKPGTKFESRYLRMDDVSFMFGWPQNKGSLWGTIGGWGYEGDWLLKQNRRFEHELNAAEILVALAPSPKLSDQLADLWKSLMVTQNHDVFIVSGFPAEYEGVRTTNLEVAGMRFREVEAGIREVRRSVLKGLNHVDSRSPAHTLICENPTNVAVRQPVMFEMETQNSSDCTLQGEERPVEVQRIPGEHINSKPQFIALIDLPPCGFKSFSLLKKSPAKSWQPASSSGKIENEHYSVKWDESRKGFLVSDRTASRSVLFRPFSGDIIHVKESFWKAPNSGVTFRAAKFDEVGYEQKVEATGPLYHALELRGDIIKLKTTSSSGAWVTARAILYRGIRRVDIHAQLHTYPRMGFLALAELEMQSAQTQAFSDFPFGEGPNQNKQFSALNYVRLQAPNYSVLLAHGGTQQFFREQNQNVTTLRNMIARQTLKGDYQWRWSLTMGKDFSPVESFRFAEGFWGPISDLTTGNHRLNSSLVSVNDPTIVIFRFARERNKTLLWLMNYSDQPKHAELKFPAALQSAQRTDMEGKQLEGIPPVLGQSGKSVSLHLSAWEMTVIEIESS